MSEPAPQYVDPNVSRTKFDREVAEYQSLEPEFRARGWLLARVAFPEILVAMCSTKTTPPAVVTGILFDYTNYDAEPPSVKLVDPFTAEPYPASKLPTVLKRRVPAPAIEIAGLPIPPGVQPQFFGEQPLMQWAGPDDIPFLCVAGVREYHDHPAHSGDAWELHRAGGAGRLVRLLEVVDTYGLRPISGYNVTLTPQIVGFIQSETPE